MDCFAATPDTDTRHLSVSISALSDRGLLHNAPADMTQYDGCFNIRSFGSWIASLRDSPHILFVVTFQYPLFRIVDCFLLPLRTGVISNVFQYPLFRIVDCFALSSYSRTLVRIVSISALSDRGLLRFAYHQNTGEHCRFQYPLFRIVDCFPVAAHIRADS